VLGRGWRGVNGARGRQGDPPEKTVFNLMLYVSTMGRSCFRHTLTRDGTTTEKMLENELIYILRIYMSEFASLISHLLSFIVPLAVVMAPSLIAM